MSDSLKDRLASHSGSFEGLLSLIPAKYYYEDDAKSQLKETSDKAAHSQPQDAGRAKRARLGSEVGSSALDELKRREGSALSSEEQDGDEDNDDVPIYDDHGNQIGGPREQSIQEILQAKARGDGSSAAAGKEHPGTEQAQKPVGPKQAPTAAKRSGPKEDKQASEKRNGSTAAGSGRSESRMRRDSAAAPEPAAAAAPAAPAAPETNGEAASKAVNGAVTEGANGNGHAKQASPLDSKKGISELRAKLAARISEMRAKRKAPGSDAPGAPKNREELLAQRKQRQEQKQKAQSLKRKRDGPESDDENGGTGRGRGEGDDVDDAVEDSVDGYSQPVDENLMFGQVKFNDGTRLGRDLRHIEEQKRVKKRNAIDQLRVIESRKAKVEQLAEDKRKQVEENAKWSRAILQSEGAKVRDNEKLLRKTLLAKERQKSKSAKAWRDRKETVKNDIATREAKRTANIKAHREAKQLRLKGKKRKEHMKRAGFEGRHR